jgi:hypothetical protein
MKARIDPVALDRLRRFAYIPALVPRAQVAQLVEQATENRRVGGSIPPLGTILFNGLGPSAFSPFV